MNLSAWVAKFPSYQYKGKNHIDRKRNREKACEKANNKGNTSQKFNNCYKIDEKCSKTKMSEEHCHGYKM